MFLTFSTWLQSHVLILLYEMVFSLFTNPGSLGSLCIIFDIQLLSYLCAYNPLETRAFTSVCTSLSFWLITLVYFRNFYSICWSQPQLPSLYFFPSLIVIIRTSKTMFSKSGESGYHFLVSNLRGNAFRFLPLSMMLAEVLSYVAFIMLK